MAETPDSPSATPLTARGVASSRRVTMSSVTGSRIWQAGHSPPLTYATTPSYTRVAPWRGRNLSPPDPVTTPNRGTLHQRPQNRRETFWSGTYGPTGQTVFTTCVSWTLMQSPIGRIPLRDVWRRRRGVRRRCTWMLAFSSVDTSHPSLPLLMDFSGWRRRLPWKG